jgi:D-alanyl-D-alanine carboxypeptidase (penicillin-binding protein 5/6)
VNQLVDELFYARRRSASSYWIAGFLFCLAFFLCGFASPRLTDREVDPLYRVPVETLEQWAELQTLSDISARAALVYDLDAKRILLARAAEQALPPASLTKLMTALLILEDGDFDSSVTVQSEDLVGDANMGLQPGEVISVEDLLYGLLIPSANEAAMALARHNAGDVAAFVERMNRRARALGLQNTRFLNPHGLDQEGHVSSAADMLTLTLALWKYPKFRAIVATADTTVAGHALRTTNEILGVDERINGVKTGTTVAAGQCLAAGLLDAQGHQRFIIVLGSEDRYADVRRLADMAQSQFVWTQLSLQRIPALSRIYQADGSLHYLQTTTQPSALLLSPLDSGALRAVFRLAESEFIAKKPDTALGELEWQLAGVPIRRQTLLLR